MVERYCVDKPDQVALNPVIAVTPISASRFWRARKIRAVTPWTLGIVGNGPPSMVLRLDTILM